MNTRYRLGVVVLMIALLSAWLPNVRAEALPERAYIPGVIGHAQKFTLSCEARSAVDWAAYWGVVIREKKFFLSLPRSDNPDAGFVGDVDGVWGNIPPRSYGVHAEPVAAMLREYGFEAQARRGLEWDDLRAEIAAGRPVIVWVIGQMWQGSPVRYTASDGHSTVVARYEHTMILVGYDRVYVYVVDAFSGQNQTYPLGTFLASWKTLGRMAITGRAPRPAAAPTSEPATQPTNLPDEPAEHLFLPLVFGLSQHQQMVAQGDNPEIYTVKRGDYLVALARRFGLDWQKLAELNGIRYPFTIHPGQSLRLR